MASSVIHMCVAKKINDKLKMPQNILLLGSIAPDISKIVDETKTKSHFLNDDKTINIEKFLDKYKDKLNVPFIMGYFIHLYTDLLWDKYFISDIVNKGTITLLNGNKVEVDPEECKRLIYNDYTNLNIQLIDEYHLDLSLFYEEINIPDIYMDEIPIDKLNLLVEQCGLIIKNTKEEKLYAFDLKNVKPFIEISANLIYLKIVEILS